MSHMEKSADEPFHAQCWKKVKHISKVLQRLHRKILKIC